MTISFEKENILKNIAEVAEELELKAYVIRYWETQFAEINPIRKNNKRLYSRECIKILKEVKKLLHEQGFTIRGAQQYLQEKYKEGKNIKQQSKNKPQILKELKTLKSFLMKFIDC